MHITAIITVLRNPHTTQNVFKATTREFGVCTPLSQEKEKAQEFDRMFIKNAGIKKAASVKAFTCCTSHIEKGFGKKHNDASCRKYKPARKCAHLSLLNAQQYAHFITTSREYPGGNKHF